MNAVYEHIAFDWFATQEMEDEKSVSQFVTITVTDTTTPGRISVDMQSSVQVLMQLQYSCIKIRTGDDHSTNTGWSQGCVHGANVISASLF